MSQTYNIMARLPSKYRKDVHKYRSICEKDSNESMTLEESAAELLILGIEDQPWNQKKSKSS